MDQSSCVIRTGRCSKDNIRMACRTDFSGIAHKNKTKKVFHLHFFNCWLTTFRLINAYGDLEFFGCLVNGWPQEGVHNWRILRFLKQSLAIKKLSEKALLGYMVNMVDIFQDFRKRIVMHKGPKTLFPSQKMIYSS